jgi:hypothetical protein
MRVLVCLAFGFLVCCAAVPHEAPSNAPSVLRCAPGTGCWPNEEEWRRFASSLTGKLGRPASPLEACRKDATSTDCASEMSRLKNPL